MKRWRVWERTRVCRVSNQERSRRRHTWLSARRAGEMGSTGDNPDHDLPQGIGLGETWDPDILRQVGAIEGYEARYIFQSSNTIRAESSSDRPMPILVAIHAGKNRRMLRRRSLFQRHDGRRFCERAARRRQRYWQAAALMKHFLANSNEDESR